jgi:hypothetical protein
VCNSSYFIEVEEQGYKTNLGKDNREALSQKEKQTVWVL